jgi:hypothetical protein
MSKIFHNGTKIIAKHDTIFQGEEVYFYHDTHGKNTPKCPGAEDSSPLTWSLKVLLASLTVSNRGRYHSGYPESAGVVHWKNWLLQCWITIPTVVSLAYISIT